MRGRDTRWCRLTPLLLAISTLASVTGAKPGGPALAYVDNIVNHDSLVVLDNTKSAVIKPNTQTQPPVGPIAFDPSDLIVVSTLDGVLHGVHKHSGRTLWSTLDNWGPLVSVAENPMAILDEEDVEFSWGQPAPGADDDQPVADRRWAMGEDGIIIPEPVGDGNLYHFMPGSPIKVRRMMICLVIHSSIMPPRLLYDRIRSPQLPVL
jgi:hypothetical protein